MKRTITMTNHREAKPKGARWRTIGLTGHADYQVRYDRGHMETGHAGYSTLTQARKDARSIVAEGRAWAEVFRYWEDGTRIGKAFIASYEVDWESGSTVL